MPIEDVIIKLLRYKYWLFLIALLTFGISFYVVHYAMVRQEAEVVFMLNDIQITDMGLTEKELATSAQASALTTERFYKFLFSDEMVKNLDARLQLGKHFGRSVSDASYKWKVSNDFFGSIVITKNGFNFMNMIVYDKDAAFAAQLSDAIVDELKKMHKQYLQKEIDQRVRMYETILNSIHTDYRLSMDSMNATLQKISETNRPALPLSSEMELKSATIKFTTKLDDIAARFGYISKAYLISKQAAESGTSDKFYVINKKYFQNPSPMLSVHLMIALFMTLLMLLVVLVAGYFYFTHPHLMSLLFKRKIHP